MLVADQMIQMLENDDRSEPHVSLADQKDVAYVLVWYENNFLLSPSPGTSAFTSWFISRLKLVWKDTTDWDCL